MGDDERRYDVGMNDHGHFICEKCGLIRDFCIELYDYVTDLPPDYRVKKRDVYYRGLCDQCLAQAQNDNRME